MRECHARNLFQRNKPISLPASDRLVGLLSRVTLICRHVYICVRLHFAVFILLSIANDNFPDSLGHLVVKVRNGTREKLYVMDV